MQNSYAHAHTRSQASSMQAKTLPSTHSFRHEWCMATSWSNSPHVRHAGTSALHTHKCLRWLETSVLHSSPVRCYLALCYRDDTHTHMRADESRSFPPPHAQEVARLKSCQTTKNFVPCWTDHSAASGFVWLRSSRSRGSVNVYNTRRINRSRATCSASLES